MPHEVSKKHFHIFRYLMRRHGALYRNIKRHLQDKGEDTMEHRAVALYTHEKGPEMINEKMRNIEKWSGRYSSHLLRGRDCIEKALALAACILIQHYILSKPYTNIVSTLTRRTDQDLEGAMRGHPHPTSYSQRDQREFGNGKIVIRTRYGRDISHLSFFPHEREVLLPAGYEANIVDVEGYFPQD